MLVAVVAGLAAVAAYAQSTVGSVPAVVITLAIALAVGLAVYGCALAAVTTTEWHVSDGALTISSRTISSRSIPLSAIHDVTRERIAGFGLTEDVFVFRDNSGNCLLWTVAARWRDEDLEPLWRAIGLRPQASASITHDYHSFPPGCRG